MVSLESPRTPVAISPEEYASFMDFKRSRSLSLDKQLSGEHKSIQEDIASLSESSSENPDEVNVFGDRMYCLARACGKAGVFVPYNIRRVADMSKSALTTLSAMKGFKVLVKAYSQKDKRNHIELIGNEAGNFLSKITFPESGGVDDHVLSVTTMQHFFNSSNQWASHKFYAEGFGTEKLFKQDMGNVGAPGSIRAESVSGGSANIGGGVSRPRKRVVGAKSGLMFGTAGINKNYRTTGAILFNNAEELFQDSISRTYAQEIIEDVFDTWGVPMDQPEAATYAENLLWTFIVAVTASNKADYNRVYDIPVRPIERNGESVTSVEADFSVFSRILEAKFGITRRQFSRGVADDLRNFLRHDENQALLPTLATRVGCEPLMAYLAFDGSTHCTGLTTREAAFTRTLEQRNLFERDDENAAGASDRLMQGFSGSVRSVQPR
nr:TPA_asm: P9 protein [Grapevine associated jivivirus 1]